MASLPFPPDLPALHRAWARLMEQCPAPLPDRVRDELIKAWSEPWRHYHAPLHLAEGMTHLFSCMVHLEHPGEVGVAWWFHDAVYNPKGCDNELKSALWAERVLREAAWPEVSIQRVRELIMRTEGHHDPQTTDEAYFLDVDLAILGASPARFAEYEAQIRQEYHHVPGLLYKPGRRKIMSAFAHRKPLYVTRHFRDAFGAQADVNLAPWKE